VHPRVFRDRLVRDRLVRRRLVRVWVLWDFSDRLLRDWVFRDWVLHPRVFSDRLFRKRLLRHWVLWDWVFRDWVFSNRLLRDWVFRKRVFSNRLFGKRVFGDRLVRRRLVRVWVFSDRLLRHWVLHPRVFRDRLFRDWVFRKRVFSNRLLRDWVFRDWVFGHRLVRGWVLHPRVFRHWIFRKRVFSDWVLRDFSDRLLRKRAVRDLLVMVWVLWDFSDRLLRDWVFRDWVFRKRVFSNRLFGKRVFGHRLVRGWLLHPRVFRRRLVRHRLVRGWVLHPRVFRGWGVRDWVLRDWVFRKRILRKRVVRHSRHLDQRRERPVEGDTPRRPACVHVNDLKRRVIGRRQDARRQLGLGVEAREDVRAHNPAKRPYMLQRQEHKVAARQLPGHRRGLGRQRQKLEGGRQHGLGPAVRRDGAHARNSQAAAFRGEPLQREGVEDGSLAVLQGRGQGRGAHRKLAPNQRGQRCHRRFPCRHLALHRVPCRRCHRVLGLPGHKRYPSVNILRKGVARGREAHDVRCGRAGGVGVEPRDTDHGSHIHIPNIKNNIRNLPGRLTPKAQAQTNPSSNQPSLKM
jgi:hypothetical protein